MTTKENFNAEAFLSSLTSQEKQRLTSAVKIMADWIARSKTAKPRPNKR